MYEKYTIQLADMQNPKTLESIWHLLKMCNDEFVPPLNARSSTVSKSFALEASNTLKEPIAYFEMLKKQNMLIATCATEIVGFMSFRNAYSTSELSGWNPSNYITTICIDKRFRNIGICSGLYKAMFTDLPHELKNTVTSTRTWGGNDKHIHLLQKLRFELVRRVVNDRGFGIDSLYWARRTCL